MGCPERFEDVTGVKVPNVTGLVLDGCVLYVNIINKVLSFLPVVTICKREKIKGKRI